MYSMEKFVSPGLSKFEPSTARGFIATPVHIVLVSISHLVRI